MSAVDEERDDMLVLEYEFDEPPEKVWRAVSIAELRQRWLPDSLLAEASRLLRSPARRSATGCGTTSRPSSPAP